MPLYDYSCPKCDETSERFLPMDHQAPVCECGEVMTRRYSTDHMRVKMGYLLWWDRMDDIHKSQEQRGERLRFVLPKEIGANSL